METYTLEPRASARIDVVSGYIPIHAPLSVPGITVLAWDLRPLREIFGGCPTVSLVLMGDHERAATNTVHIPDLLDEQWREQSRRAAEYFHLFFLERVPAKGFRVLQTVVEA